MINRKALITGASVFLTSMLCVGFLLTPNDTIKTKEAERKITYKDKIEGFPQNTKMDAKYFSGQKDVYSVYYIIERESYKFIDIELILNKNSNQLKAVISGLPTDTKVSFFSDRNKDNDALPVDWAGRLTFTSQYLNEKELCFLFEGLYKGQTPTLCHAPDNREVQVPS